MDDETMESDRKLVEKAKRAEKLGFKPQKEIFCNRLLPYAEIVDDESNKMLNEIKNQLGKALALRDTIGISMVTIHLVNYMRIYGYKFSKEDHIKFIKIYLEYLVIPDLGFSQASKCCSVLCGLLKKLHLLSPKDLELDWKVFNEIAKIIIYKSDTKGVHYRHTCPIDTNLVALIQQSAIYFPKSATQEILNEFYPKLETRESGKYSGAFEMLSLFLNPIEGYEIWLDDFLSLWLSYHNATFSCDVLHCVSRAAKLNIGYIDWEPHIPTMFARIMRSIDLPVTYKAITCAKRPNLWASSIATWIVSTLGPSSSSQKYLCKLMGVIESYLHPANSGKWVTTLSDILVHLTRAFLDRLIFERYRPISWKRPTPDTHKLSEECITAFVECMRPVALQAMYSRMSATDVAKIFKALADLRPQLIIEDVINRVTTTLESVTEPHKMTAALQCLISVSRAIVTCHEGYTAGKIEAIPILFSTLPGIDPNDFKKTAVTLQFLTSFSCLVPIVDCSKAGLVRDDMTEDEHTICCQTADLENFVLLFMDKIFLLIDSSSVESIRMEQAQSDQVRSKLESITEAWVTSAVHAVLAQCSDDILKSGSEKVIKFVQSNLFEPKVAGLIVSAVIRVYARVAAKYILPALVPYITGKIEDYFTHHADIEGLEKQSDEFLYYLTLLIGIVRGDPKAVIQNENRELIVPIIDRTIKFKCRSTQRIITNVIVYWLSNISAIQTLDVRSLPNSYTKPLEEYLPIRHWGEKMNPNDKIDWYFADDDARAFCEWMIHRYLPPALDRLEKFINGELVLPKEDICYALSLISSLTKCSNFLPTWEGEESEIPFAESEAFYYRPKITNGFDSKVIKMPDGKNVRLSIVKTALRLQEKMLKDHEDDIRSFIAIISLLDKIHFQRHNVNVYESQIKNYSNTKVFQDFNLTKHKRDLRTVVASRVLIQHDLREECNRPRFTESHREILLSLLTLSTSRYSDVRFFAQSKLFSMLSNYPYGYQCIVDILAENLKVDPNEQHDLFKGTLYVMAGYRRIKLFLKNDWNVLEKLWLGLLRTKLSEKPSIVNLTDHITDSMNQELTTITIKIEISSSLVKKGIDLIVDDDQRPSQQDIDDGEKALQTKCEQRMQTYTNLINSIVDIVNQEGTHWRHHLIASSMLYNLDHPQSVYNRKITKYILDNLIHDSIEERKIAIPLIILVLKHEKREHPKIDVDPFTVAGVPRVEGKLSIGIRPDNKFLQYDIETVPRNQSDWDVPRFSFRSNGFFGWPNVYKAYAPSAQQPNLDREPDEMNEVHREVYNFFSDDANVDSLIKLWSLEEKKGRDKFNRWRYVMIKFLFNEFGDKFLDKLLSCVKTLIEDKKNTEGSHRCAAEILTGMLRGAKHWDYERTSKMFDKLLPVIRLILKNITVESEMNWGTCFASATEHMDPNRQHWLHEVMMENFFSDELTSYNSCSRIYCFQGVFAQHIWRMNTVGHRVLNSVKPFLSHSFQNVRERLGSLLINVYDSDFQFPGANPPEGPRIKDLIAELSPKLQVLYGEQPKVRQTVAENSIEESEEELKYNEAIRIFKTIGQFMTGYLNRSLNVNRAEFFEILPLACRLERSETDAELVEVATSLLAMMSLALTYPDTMEHALSKIDQVSLMTSWTAKLSILEFLQAMIFHNMPMVISSDAWVLKVKTIVLRLLEDSSIEVREKAAQVLGGLIHCSFLPATDELLEQFKKKCRTKLIRRSGMKLTASTVDGSCSSEAREANSIRERHIGVLGLCAFISAYPYDIPEIVPKAFEQLGAHLNDPQPIPATIRKTVGNFKRTHQDNWATLQLKLTEDQLAVLTDVDVPPSYYA